MLTHGQDWVRFDQNENNFTYQALDVALKKKKLKTFTTFPDLTYIFQTLSMPWKIAGQIWRLFQEFKTPYEPWI